jgi:hypothetical protein
MITQPTTTQETNTETPEAGKARRNAEYMAKLDKAFREIEAGEGITMTFEEWEKRFCKTT